MQHRAKLETIAAESPYPFIFVTVSGAHLYGFESPNSDFDLRGCHILPSRELLGLDRGPETIERSEIRDGLDLDIVSHDAEKFFSLMLKNSGYVLEQLFSPIVIASSPYHEELKTIGRRCVTKNHAHHYRGFFRTQVGLFKKESPPRVKPLLYIYRVLLTGIRLMRTGAIEANLNILNDEFRLPQIPDLIAQKRSGAEKQTLAAVDIPFHEREFENLLSLLDSAEKASTLPLETSARPDLHNLLLRIRMK